MKDSTLRMKDWSIYSKKKEKKKKAESQQLKCSVKRAKAEARINRKIKYRSSHPFYSSIQWRALRAQILCQNKECCRCGAESFLEVDHIKPRWKYPHLALDKNNLQVLCERCNRGKGHLDETDWRGFYKRVSCIKK